MPKPKNIIKCLTPHEAERVLSELLRQHPEIRSETDTIAAEVITDVSVDDIRDDVANRLRAIDPAELHGRAGSQAGGGYVEPSEAAWEILEEAVADIRDDIKRRVESGHPNAAEKVCRGLILGLYDVRKTESDSLLAWAPDFPAEAAGWTMSEFLALFPRSQRSRVGDQMLSDLRDQAGEWIEMIERIVKEALK